MPLLLCILTISAFQLPVPKPTIYLPDRGFVMEFPQGWQTRSEGVEPMTGVAENPQLRALVLVSATPLVFDVNDRKHLREYLDTMKAKFKTFEIKEKAQPKVADVPAEQVVFTVSNDTVEITYLSLSFHKFGEQYLIHMASKPETFETLEKDFQTMLESLSITGPKNAEQTRAFLAQAAREEPDYSLMNQLLAEGADINGLTQKKVGALFLAINNKNGKLVKWLLEKGINPENPKQDFMMLSLMATPAIRTLMKNAVNKDKPKPKKKPSGGEGLQIQWRSNEAQLFAGIHNANLSYVKEAIRKGVDPQARDTTYNLPPLECVRRIIKDFEELDLDASEYKPIEVWLNEHGISGEKSK